MIEKEIEKRVCAYAKTNGILNFKFSSPAHRGVPDQLFFMRPGVLVLVEFKSETGRLTPLQERTIDAIKRMAFRVEVVRSVEQGKRLVDEMVSVGRLRG